jgi:hypothetical protein
VFLQIVREFRKLYICIDALDECKEKHRGILLQSLAKVSKDCKRDCFRMFVTGRPHLNWDKKYTASLRPRLSSSNLFRSESGRYQDICGA